MFPLGISIGLTVVILIFFLFAALFLDFVKDSWKLPFAIVADVIDFVAMMNPGWLDIAAAAYGFLIFIILARSVIKYPSAFAVGAEGFINIGRPFSMPLIGQVTGLLPINTILMFIDTIID